MFLEFKNTTFESITSKILHFVTPLVIDTSKHKFKKIYNVHILLSKTTINLFIRTQEYVKNICTLLTMCLYL